ncbi:MAG: hypothetical protein ACPGTQ_04585 [Colwellia sp.]
MCEVGNEFKLCRCDTDNINARNTPYWQLLRVVGNPKEKAAQRNPIEHDALSLTDDCLDSDEFEMEVGDIIAPPILHSVTYQSFCDELNARPCFDTAIAHQESDILIIHLTEDAYRYRYSNNQWHRDCEDMNEPLRVLNDSGIVEGVEHIKPYNNDDGAYISF